MFDPESEQFTYSDILHRIQLKKTRLNSEDKRRRGAIVHRRGYSKGEAERREQLQLEYGGLYYDELDSAEHVREFKRRRASEKRAAGDTAASSPSPSPQDDDTNDDDGNEDEETKSSEPPAEAPPAAQQPAPANDGNDSPAISDGSSGSDSDSE